MPRPCAVCLHAERSAIDKALVAGEPVTRLSALFRVSPDSLDRHKANHLPAALAKAKEAGEVARADDLLRDVRALRSKAVALLLRAEREGDLRTALAGVSEARNCLELLAEMEGELDRRPVVNVLMMPEWVAIRAALLAALRPYPDARAAVAERVATLEGRAGTE